MCAVPDGAQWTRVEEIVQLIPTMKSLGGADNKKDQAAESAPVEEKKEEKIDFSKVEIEPLFKEFVDFDTFSK